MNLFDGASMRLTDFALKDFTKIPNSLMGGSSVPATASFSIRWRTERLVIDKDNRFSGRFFGNSATIQWSSKQDGFQFVSDPLETPSNEFSLIGDERNGVFFP